MTTDAAELHGYPVPHVPVWIRAGVSNGREVLWSAFVRCQLCDAFWKVEPYDHAEARDQEHADREGALPGPRDEQQAEEPGDAAHEGAEEGEGMTDKPGMQEQISEKLKLRFHEQWIYTVTTRPERFQAQWDGERIVSVVDADTGMVYVPEGWAS